MEIFLADLRHALRGLRHSTSFAATAILTLALGIGSNTAVFSVANSVLFRPLPFDRQDRLFMLAEQSQEGGLRPPSYPTFLAWRAQASAFAGLAYVRGSPQALRDAEGVQNLPASFVSPGFFATLGERPLLGRVFTPDEDRTGTPVAVLSYNLWQTRFGGDPHIIGKALSLSAGVFTVVGILPHDVVYPPWATEQLYAPLATIVATERALTQRGFHADSRIIGRLKPEISLAQAKAVLDGVARREALAHPDFNADWTATRFFSLRDEILGPDTSQQLLVLVAAVGLVLVIACVNVANLTFARAGARSRELAIRAALGAGRGRVVRQLFAETLVLATAGAVLGVLAAYGAITMFKQLAPAVWPRLETVEVDGRVLVFALGVTTLSAAATGLVPALRVARSDLTDPLKEGTTGAGIGRGRRRLRGALVIGEIALAVILVVGAGLLMRSLLQLRAVNPGFEPDGLVVAYIVPPPVRAKTPANLTSLYRRIEDAARTLPGVTSVALTNFTPLSGGGLSSPVEVVGRVPDPVRDPQVWFMTVSPDYFRTMRIPIRTGRGFTNADLTAGTAVVVNETFARAYLSDSDPIGRQLTLHKAAQGRPDFGEPFAGTVVGVVGDVHHFGLGTPAEPQVYVPFTRNVWGHMSLVVRAARAPNGLIAPLRRTVRQVDPDIPMTLTGSNGSISTVDTVDVAGGLASRRLDTWLASGFAASALFLAALGIYGLLAYTVAERRRELGIRVALGAVSGDLLRLVVSDGMRLAGIGIGVGLVGALAVTRVLATLLYGVGPSDLPTFMGVAAVLGMVSLGASYLPARRAARCDPILTLRHE